LQLHQFFTINLPALHGAYSARSLNVPSPANWPQGDPIMQTKFQAKITVLIIVSACVFAAKANAECGDLSKLKLGASLHQQSWGGSQFGTASLLLVDSGDPIVGFWKVTFTSEGTIGIPDDTVIDSAYAQWHSDGTEIMNSSRPPVTQSFCLGVWKKVGGLHYKLNHFAKSFDPNSNPVGPAVIREDVVLSPGGKSFVGSFTIDQYDGAGNTLIHITGDLTGTRITVDSPASVAF